MKREGNCGSYREENTGEQMSCSRIQAWEPMLFLRTGRKAHERDAVVQGSWIRRLVLVLCEDTLFLLVNLRMNKVRIESGDQITHHL